MEHSCEFQMGGQTWKCIRKPFHGEAECRVKTRTIFVDVKFDEEDFLDYLHHELTEAATYYMGCSYNKEHPDEDTIFIMNHTQMDNVSSAVRGAYEAIKKIMLPLSAEKGKGPAAAEPVPKPQQKT